jgi:NNP family nitrate/nitrite transporter-like MFS transporter
MLELHVAASLIWKEGEWLTVHVGLARKNPTFLVLWLVGAYGWMLVFDFAPLVPPIAEDMGINYTQVGALQTATFLPYSVLQIVAGVVADIYPGKRVITAAVGSLTIASILSALSPTYVAIMICRVLVGVSMAFVFVPTAKLLRDSVEENVQGTIFGSYGSSLAAGAIGAAVLPMLLLYQLQSWRLALLVLATLGIGAFILAAHTPAEYASKNEMELEVARGSFSSMLKMPQNWSLAYDQLVRGGLGVGLSTWIPTSMVQQHGFSLFESSLILGGIWMLALIGSPLGGVVSDKVRSNFAVIELTLIILAPAVLILATTADPSVLWISSLLVGALVFFNMGPLFATLPRMVGSKRLGLAIGLHNMFASAGAFTIPIVLGYVRDSTGAFTLGWFVVVILIVIGVLASINLRHY